MGRKKNTSPKMAELAYPDKLLSSLYGPKAANPQFLRACVWLDAATRPGLNPQEAVRLLEQMAEEHFKGNTTFFAALAEITARIKGAKREPDEEVYSRVRVFLLKEYGWEFQNAEQPTLGELKSAIIKHGIATQIDASNLRRICVEIGLKLKPVKVGRPPKN